MRTRTKTTVHRTYTNGGRGTIPITSTSCAGVIATGTYYDGPVSGLITSATKESMSDWLGRGASHAVSHTKCRYDSDTTMDYLGPTGNGTIPYGPLTLIPTYNRSTLLQHTAFDTLPAPLPPGWSFVGGSVDEELLKASVLDSARQLKADVLLNIIEANQIWPSLRSLATAIPNMARHWLQLRKVISTASGAYLAWKFGVSPILSDVMSIVRYLPTLKSDLIRHRDGDKSRYSRAAELTMQCVEGTVYDDSITRHYRIGKVHAKPLIRYVLVVKPKMRFSSSAFKALDFLASRFSTSPARLAWELVPFSFVADWFVDIRGALNAIDGLVGHEPYEITSFTRSFSYHVESTISWDQRNPCGGTLGTRVAGSTEWKHYERSLAVPNQLIRWQPRFGKSQAGITAALISQQLSRIGR